MKNYFCLSLALCCGIISSSFAQTENKFEQLYDKLPTPTPYRTASGAPGAEYYQQQADYVIDVTLDDAKQDIYGVESVIYTNNSPDGLSYLWLQLDQNMQSPNSDTRLINTTTLDEREPIGTLMYFHQTQDFEGGYNIAYVHDSKNAPLPYAIYGTMMRINLPYVLQPKQRFAFSVKWAYHINDRMKVGGRSGYEFFEKENNYLYTLAQFFPRLCVYNETEGWQTNAFLGSSEFALAFGNYTVNITVPEDHVVAATGELQNDYAVLTETQRERFKQAATSPTPMFIVTPDEAKAAEQQRAKGTKTWKFRAENVRDFAFASSRKFMWDAQGVKFGDRTVMAMSYYPKEGNPLWEKYSTRAVAITLNTYSKYSFDYPYPVAISVHTHQIGMEYPMICFNGGRPEADGTYSEATKYGMISVVIHEVGHNYFPMIVNSDERQWTWMDEGLNTFLQYLTEQEWERGYPSHRGPAANIVNYMKGDRKNMSPIMSNGDCLLQMGNNAYGKPATALNILRETIMGRERFDFAFKTYCQRWKFKHPTPADFFRSMEDASGMDLDWFWRGWFYTTEPVDISLDEVMAFRLNTRNPDIEKPLAKADAKQPDISSIRNKTSIAQTLQEREPAIVTDFYNTFDKYAITAADRRDYEAYISRLTPEEKELVQKDYYYYQLSFSNKGGTLMPIIVQFTFADGATELVYIPAQIWQKHNDSVSKLFYFTQEVVSVQLDPLRETADIDTDNNYFPRRMEKTRIELYKESQMRENEMQRAAKAKKQ